MGNWKPFNPIKCFNYKRCTEIPVQGGGIMQGSCAWDQHYVEETVPEVANLVAKTNVIIGRAKNGDIPTTIELNELKEVEIKLKLTGGAAPWDPYHVNWDFRHIGKEALSSMQTYFQEQNATKKPKDEDKELAHPELPEWYVISGNVRACARSTNLSNMLTPDMAKYISRAMNIWSSTTVIRDTDGWISYVDIKIEKKAAGIKKSHLLLPELSRLPKVHSPRLQGRTKRTKLIRECPENRGDLTCINH
jgi:hypothetical protein